MLGPTFKRFAVLFACLAFAACASAPTPAKSKKKKKKKSTDDTELVTKKKKKKKKKKPKVEVAEADDEDERDREDDEDEDAPRKKKKKPKKKKKSDDDADADVEEAEARLAQEERARERERERAEAEAEERKAEAERKKKEEAERQAAAAARKKEEAERKKAAEAERKAEAKRKKEEAAAAALAAKQAKKKKKVEDVEKDEEPDEEEIVIDEPEPEPQAKKKKKPVQVAAAEEAAIDMTDAEPVEEPKKKAEPEPEEDSAPIDFDKMEAEDDPLAEKRVAAIPVAGVSDDDEADSSSDSDTPSLAGPTLTTRPLTLGKGKLEVHGGIRATSLTIPGMTPDMNISASSQALLLGGTYGIGTKAEIGADYGLSVNPGSIKGPFALRAAYQVKAGKLDVAVAGALAVDFYETQHMFTGATLSTTFIGLHLGAWARYHATPKVAIFTGLPSLPSTSVPMTKLALPLPPFQYQLAVGLNEAGPIALELPVGLSYQASPKLYAFTSLNLAHIRISNTTTGILFKDFIPVVLGAFYTMNKIDVGAVFSDDLKQGTDYLRFDLMLRYMIK